MKTIISEIVNEYNDRVERLDNTQEELTTIIGQQEERNKKLLLFLIDSVPWMSGLVSGLQNHVRRFESARNLGGKPRSCL